MAALLHLYFLKLFVTFIEALEKWNPFSEGYCLV